MDTIADMLTRMRNAIMAKKDVVEIPASRLKKEIARVLREEGYIANYRIFEDGKAGQLKILLRYSNAREPAILRLIKVSHASRRIYRQWNELTTRHDAFATSIVSTSKGVMTAKKAKNLKIGGEVLLKVW